MVVFNFTENSPQTIHLLCSVEKRKPNRFGTTQGWVKNDRIRFLSSKNRGKWECCIDGTLWFLHIYKSFCLRHSVWFCVKGVRGKVVNLTKMTRCHEAGAASHTHTHTRENVSEMLTRTYAWHVQILSLIKMNDVYMFCLTPWRSDFQPDDLQYQLDKLDLIVSHDLSNLKA